MPSTRLLPASTMTSLLAPKIYTRSSITHKSKLLKDTKCAGKFAITFDSYSRYSQGKQHKQGSEGEYSYIAKSGKKKEI